MTAKLNYTEQEIIHLIGRHNSLTNMVAEFHKHPHPFVTIGEHERELFGVQEIIESIAKEYVRRGHDSKVMDDMRELCMRGYCVAVSFEKYGEGEPVYLPIVKVDACSSSPAQDTFAEKLVETTRQRDKLLKELQKIVNVIDINCNCMDSYKLLFHLRGTVTRIISEVEADNEQKR